MSTIQEKEIAWCKDKHIRPKGVIHDMALCAMSFTGLSVLVIIHAFISGSAASQIVGPLCLSVALVCVVLILRDQKVHIDLLREEVTANYGREHELEVEVGFLRPQTDMGRLDAPR